MESRGSGDSLPSALGGDTRMNICRRIRIDARYAAGVASFSLISIFTAAGGVPLTKS